MLILLYLVLVAIALYCVFKTLLPELNKSSSPKIAPKPKTADRYQSHKPYTPDTQVEKFENLLAEKNKRIDLLEKDLRSLNAQARAFGKIKTLLDEEIHRLREQNRIFRSELGLPTVQHKENSIT